MIKEIEEFKEIVEKQKRIVVAKDKNNLANRVITYPKQASKYGYIHQNLLVTNYIPYDCDFDVSTYLLKKELIPIPTILVRNKDNNKAHLLYKLATPIPSNATNKTKILFKIVDDELTNQLKADQGYIGLWFKNPLFKDYRLETFEKSYSLYDLVKELNLEQDYNQKKYKRGYINTPKISDGRNCCIFELSRFVAYKIAKNFDCPIEFGREIKSVCHSYNRTECFENYNLTRTNPLPRNEVNTIATSISEYVFPFRHNLSEVVKNRGALGFGSTRHDDITQPHLSSIEVNYRQSQGAYYTHDQRTQATRNKIYSAIGDLLAMGKKATYREIAEYSKLSLDTVSRYLKEK